MPRRFEFEAEEPAVLHSRWPRVYRDPCERKSERLRVIFVCWGSPPPQHMAREGICSGWMSDLREMAPTIRVRGGRAGGAAFTVAQGIPRPLRAKIRKVGGCFLVMGVAPQHMSHEG